MADKYPSYDARDIARKRCELSGALLLLGSATPSVATYMRTLPGVKPENRLELVEMLSRANHRALPSVSIVDMRSELLRGNRSIFSGELKRALEDTFSAGEQAILFLKPARLFDICELPCVRLCREVRQLRRDANVSSVRRDAALPLLRCGAQTAYGVSQLWFAIHQVLWRRYAEGRGRTADAVSGRGHGADGCGHHLGQGCACAAAERVRPGHCAGADRHADGGQRA